MSIGNLFQAFRIGASGLSAQRARLNVISSNIANANTTRTPEGGPYRRRVVNLESTGDGVRPRLFEKLLAAQKRLGFGVQKTSPRHIDEAELVSFAGRDPGVQARVAVDETTPTRREYAPGHPDADEEGYVELPNVEIVREMTDLLTATRAYEANVTVLTAAKSMFKKALEI